MGKTYQQEPKPHSQTRYQACVMNVVRRSKMYIFDRVDVCSEYFEIKSYDIENDNYLILLVYNEK